MTFGELVATIERPAARAWTCPPMYSLRPDGAVLRELGHPQRYQAKVGRQLLIKILELTLNPRPQDCKPIDAGHRVDSGEYRIYYEVDDALPGDRCAAGRQAWR